MINGVSIPVLTPFKFYPASRTIDNGINFQNIDNTELREQDWEGVYPKNFMQPVPRFWHDLSPGIDFQVNLETSTLAFASFKASIIDLDGATVEALTTVDFFTISGTLKKIRIYADSFPSVADGCYRIKLFEQGGDDIYYSEIINLADTHEDCYPFEFSNFENDFGLIFENASSVAWSGKMLIPLRLYEPLTEEEKEVYNNDVGELTTLRTIPKRVYQLTTYALPTWFAEKLKMTFGCSDLELNKVAVNTEAGLSIDTVNETDRVEVSGAIVLNDFTDEYIQEDALDSTTELITSWTDDGNWDVFNSTGKDIDLAQCTVFASALSNNISVVSGTWYLLDFETDSGDDLEDTELLVDGDTFSMLPGRNVFLYQASSTGTINVTIETQANSDFECDCSMKKIT